VALVWLMAGVAVLTRVGERAAVRSFLRYRPAAGSWLAADVAALAPGRRIEVYVAPGLSGVFCVGGHTVAAGARSVGIGTPAVALHAASSKRCATRASGGPASSWRCCGGPDRGWRAPECSAACLVRARWRSSV